MNSSEHISREPTNENQLLNLDWYPAIKLILSAYSLIDEFEVHVDNEPFKIGKTYSFSLSKSNPAPL